MLFSNNLEGTIPTELGNLGNVRGGVAFLYAFFILLEFYFIFHSTLFFQNDSSISYNNIQGTLPSEIGSIYGANQMYVFL